MTLYRLKPAQVLVLARRCSTTSSNEAAASRAARKERWKAAHGQSGLAGDAESKARLGSTVSTTSGVRSPVWWAIGSGVAAFAGVAYVKTRNVPAIDHSDAPESWDSWLRDSAIGSPYSFFYDHVLAPFVNPSRQKLLPNWHDIPNVPPDYPCPPTLVLDVEETLIAATWDQKYGWRYAKRPGLDKFLAELSRYYEIVLFASSNYAVIDPVLFSIDKGEHVLHRLYRDSTQLYRGKHVKDLSKLNRDLKKVVVVDDDPDCFQFQPNNGIRIKAYKDARDKTDKSLDKLGKFLIALVMESVDDIPAVLRQFQGKDAEEIGNAYEALIRDYKFREFQKQNRGLGKILRSGKAIQKASNPSIETGAAVKGSSLSAKSIVGDTRKFDLKEEEEERAPAPVKKGKLWKAYEAHLKESEEDARRKFEAWNAAMQKQAEEERKRQLGIGVVASKS